MHALGNQEEHKGKHMCMANVLIVMLQLDPGALSSLRARNDMYCEFLSKAMKLVHGVN